MQAKTRDIFATIRTEGAILPVDILQRIAEGNGNLEGIKPQDYHLRENEKLRETVSHSWERLLASWKSFGSAVEQLPETDIGTTITREKWLLPLFQELGYGRLITAKSFDLDGRTFPISHSWQHSPIHLISFKVDIDKRTTGVAGAARMSPHGMVQEFLNRSDDFLWGFLSNGLRLRILRNNISLTRQAYVEFDLAGMMDGEVYSDFVLLWLLCHQSRVESEIPEKCWLEKWSQTAKEQGMRALDQLSDDVEQAIAILGGGFLSHRANSDLKEQLKSGALDKQEYYRQLLRLVYRLIFLFVAEDRGLLLDPDAPRTAKDTYLKYYSAARLRSLAEKTRSTRHWDLWRGLALVFDKLGSDSGCPELALPPLGSYLWSTEAIGKLNNCQITNSDLLKAIRSLVSTEDVKKTRRLVDYKNLGSEELGSIYEALLELHPVLNTDAGTFELSTTGGHERKTTGSYYTHTSLVNCLLDSALDPVLSEASKKKEPEQALLSLKICDPACGSGHFLISAAHRMAKRLAAIRTGDDEPSPEATRTAIRDVIGRCVYGVDVNPMAVELCKVSLWMEALEPGKPLSFLDHHIQCGNSLLGTTPSLLAKGIPDEVFNPIEGDDKKICQEYRKRNKKEREGQLQLFDEEGRPWEHLGNLVSSMMNIEEIQDNTIEGLKQKQEKYEALVHSSNYESGWFLADAWCAAFVWKKTEEFAYPITDSVCRGIERNPHDVSGWMKDEIKRLAEQYQFFHWHLAFPDVFRIPTNGENGENELTGWSGGFDVLLGNPPWERIKLQEKEWFAERRPDIANASNASKRRKMIANLEQEDPALCLAFLEDRRKAEGESQLVRNTGVFPLCGRGDVNTYAVFAELMRSLISSVGRVGCIVPTGIATDDTTKYFFQDIVHQQSLVSLYDFENNRGIFPTVHRSYKFALMTLSGQDKPALAGTDFAFFALDVADLFEDDRHFTLIDTEIALLNPNTHTCPTFRSKHDAELTKAIYNRIPILIEEDNPNGNPWGISYFTMFHMTNDSQLFRTSEQLETAGWILNRNVYLSGTKSCLPLYEGKMIWQMNHRAASVDYRGGIVQGRHDVLSSEYKQLASADYSVMPRFWISAEDIKGKVSHKHSWLLAFRDITNTESERTNIFSIIPLVACGNNLPVLLFTSVDAKQISCLLGSLTSFAADYISRQKLGGNHLNLFLLKQLPQLHPDAYDSKAPWDELVLSNWLSSRVLEVTYTAWDLEPFAKDCGYDGPPFRWDIARRFLLHCELDAAFFHLYGIERNDVDYIMETFSIVKRQDEQKYDEYRTKRVILEIYDSMKKASETGKPYQTLLDPPPADPRVAHEPRVGTSVNQTFRQENVRVSSNTIHSSESIVQQPLIFTTESSKDRREEMADFDASKMDNAANEALTELETIREEHPVGVKAVEDWMKKWVSSAGYKRLGKILADKWN
ncbi:Eco57I restriction-modification methylase domain-containing protein [Chloroflexota bacterium]